MPDFDRLTRSGPNPKDFLRYQPIAKGFFQNTDANTTVLLENQSNATIRQTHVVKCPHCAADFQQGWPYCPSCGKVPGIAAGPSYYAVWLFAIFGLCAVGVYWVAITTAKEQAIHATLTPTPTLDAAARLVRDCGQPTEQAFLPAKPQKKQLERKTVVYKSAKIKVVFERESPQSSDGWKNAKYFDAASGKQLNSQQIAKRLPCAVAKN